MFRASRLFCLLAVLVTTLSTQACGASPDDPSKAVNARVAEEAARLNSSVDDSRRNAITRAIEAVSPAVVGINVLEVREKRIMDPFWRFFYGDRVYRENVQGLGSGFIISSDGYILTNDHVAGSATRITVTLTNGLKYDARMIGTDPVTDLCLIKIDSDDPLPYLKLGNSDDVIVGEWSIAFGNPFGLFSTSAKPTVTVGVISAMNVFLEQQDTRVYRNMLQTDAAINSGNSGGPLVNSLGEVIGINTVIYSPNQGSVGLGFAVPINRARKITEILKSGGVVDRQFYPGIRVQTVNSAIARAYRLEKIEGVIVSDLDRRGAAAKAGLEIADVIVRANGEHVTSEEMLSALIRYSIRGENITFDIIRNNAARTITMSL